MNENLFFDWDFQTFLYTYSKNKSLIELNIINKGERIITEFVE